MDYDEEVIVPGDLASKIAKGMSVASYGNCPAVEVIPHQQGNFRGAVSYKWRHPDVRNLLSLITNECGWVMLECMENDGAGTKPGFAALLNTPEAYADLGREIIAMCVDDLARTGRFPAVMSNVIDVKAVNDDNINMMRALLEGYGRTLADCNLVNITGEIAVMGSSVTSAWNYGDPSQLIFNWAGNCTGLTYRDFLIDGSNIAPNMPIVGFSEQGYRCNGGSWFTRLLQRKFGPSASAVHDSVERLSKVKHFAEMLTIPSRVFAPLITDLVGWNRNGTPGTPMASIMGMAHITGGGFAKLGEALPHEIGADLHNIPKPSEVLKIGQEWAAEFPDLAISDYECHHYLNGGVSFAVVCTSENDAGIVLETARERGYTCQIIGTTAHRGSTALSGNKLRIQSRFSGNEDLKITYED